MNHHGIHSTYQRLSPTGLIDDGIITSSSKLILREAMALGIQISQIPSTRIFRLKYKGKTRYLYNQEPGSTSAIARRVAHNKGLTKSVLLNANISVPKGFTIRKQDSEELRKSVYDHLMKPLVIKPNTGTQGISITIGVDNPVDYASAVQGAFSYSNNGDSEVIVEKELSGYTEYRVLTTRKKIIGIIKRVPANIIGDGISSIQTLVNKKNMDPRRGNFEDHPPLFKILVDESVSDFLQKQGLTTDSVPQKGEQVFLRGVSNISMGGDSYDFTDEAHPSVKEICLRAINAIPGLELGGIDFMTKDIRIKQCKESYAIIEINNSPGLDIHDYPYEGKNRRAGLEFLKILFGKL